MDRLRSYGKIYNLGHPALDGLFEGAVLVEEKIDGSQFSFGVDPDGDGAVTCRSKNQEIHPEAPPALFEAAVATAMRVAPQLEPGWVYRAECLSKPKHNALTYGRVPVGNLIVFDIDQGQDRYMNATDKAGECERLGLECVPKLDYALIESPEVLLAYMDRESVLGGVKIEGVVVKNYKRFGADGRALMGKHVSEAFKERNTKEWKRLHPSGSDILQKIGESLCREARWKKAVQHMRDDDKLQNAPQDIGPLMKSLNQDIEEECREEIKESLYLWARKRILRSATRGFPEWYKQQLLESQFENHSL